MTYDENDLFSLSINELLALNILLTLLLSDGLNSNQLNILGNFFEALGQNILIIQALVSAEPNPNAMYCLNKPNCFLPNFTASASTNFITEERFRCLETRLYKLETILTEKIQDKPN